MTLSAADAKTLNELRPFIVKRMLRGETFEAALSKAADDARAFCVQNRSAILGAVWDRCNA